VNDTFFPVHPASRRKLKQTKRAAAPILPILFIMFFLFLSHDTPLV
jgi:hypothetical protein